MNFPRFTQLGVVCLMLTATSLSTPTRASAADDVQQAATAADGSVVLTGKDGVMTLKLPAGWKPVTPKNQQILIKSEYTDGRTICVYADKKEDVISINAYAKTGKNAVVAGFPNSRAGEATLFKFDGRPAVRYLIDYDDDTYHWTVLLLFVETNNHYCQMSVTAVKSTIAANLDACIKLADGLGEKPGAGKK